MYASPVRLGEVTEGYGCIRVHALQLRRVSAPCGDREHVNSVRVINHTIADLLPASPTLVW